MADKQVRNERPLLQRWRFWAGLLLSLVCLAWLIYNTDWPQTWQTFRQTNYGLVLLAIGLNLITVPLRTARWRIMFEPHRRPTFGRLTAVMLIGQALNVIMPARMGDLVKARLVGTAGTAYVMSTVVLQTVLDLLMVGGLVIIFLFQVTLPAWWREPGFALLVMVGGAVVLVMVLAIGRHPLLRRLKMVADGRPALPLQRLVSLTEQFLNGFELLGQARLIGQAFGWSLLIWGFYGTVNYVLMEAIGINPTWTAAFFVLVVLQLGVAIPSSPGRIGVFHYLSVLALTVFAVDEAQAVSYAIMSHFISVILPIIVGLVLAWRMRIYGQEDRR